MAATKASAIFMRRNGTRLVKDVYVPDAAGACLIDATGGGAGTASPADFAAPEPLVLVDLVTGTAPTATRVAVTHNGVYTGDVLIWAVQLSTQVSRPPLGIAFNQGDKLGLANIT